MISAGELHAITRHNTDQRTRAAAMRTHARRSRKRAAAMRANAGLMATTAAVVMAHKLSADTAAESAAPPHSS